MVVARLASFGLLVYENSAAAGGHRSAHREDHLLVLAIGSLPSQFEPLPDQCADADADLQETTPSDNSTYAGNGSVHTRDTT
jgi:hypothetical protein